VKTVRVITLLLLIMVCIPAFILRSSDPVEAALDFWDLFHPTELEPGDYFTMVDQENNRIMRTARYIFPGDEYLNQSNRLYRVDKVVGRTAYATLLEVVKWKDSPVAKKTPPANSLPVQGENKRINIYSTHGDESYLPEDGTDSSPDGNGGIIDVAASLKDSLESRGIEVTQSTEPHMPHDTGAYQRSRRTAEELIKQNPDALVDVHRDAVPAEEYLADVAGEETVQVQLVVGQQNQNAATNREFANSLKQTADQLYPGLIKGVYTGRGNYNQDLGPRAILIEVGSHENSKEKAADSMDMFAEVLSVNLYGGAGPKAAAAGGSTALKSVLWVIGIAVAALAVYLLVSTGSWDELVDRLHRFFRIPTKAGDDNRE